MDYRCFREMADLLKNREKIPLDISFKSKGREITIRARLDPLFATVETPICTVPARELNQWLRLMYGADVETIKYLKGGEN
jgi:hypothetical protein